MRFEWLSGGEGGSPELIHQESGPGDTIALVFTGDELREFVSDPALHGDLTDWFAGAPVAAVLHDPIPAEAPTPDIAYLELPDQAALVIYGAPPGIEAIAANDEAGYAFTANDIGPFLYGDAEGSVTEYQPTSSPDQGHDTDPLLVALSDDGLHGGAGADVLETAGQLGTQASGGDANTFLLTHLDIADLIGDYDQIQGPAANWDAELFDHYVGAGQGLPDHGGPGTIMIEIEDGSGVASTHILT
jgi:hypothetical protein